MHEKDAKGWAWNTRGLWSLSCASPQKYIVFPCKYNFLIMFMSKKSYLKLLFSFELDSKIQNFKKNRAASCPIFPILGTACPKLGTACPIGHEAALRPCVSKLLSIFRHHPSRTVYLCPRSSASGQKFWLRINKKIFLNSPIFNSLVLNKISKRKFYFSFLPELLGIAPFLGNRDRERGTKLAQL